MRRVAPSVACVGLAWLTACSSLENQYWREGAGTTLHWSGLPEASELQDVYINYLCQQAGLSCTTVGPISGDWALFVQAGLNDIDQRCDAYLAWLDNKRRWQNPILKQISDTSTVTQALMRISGVSANPITAVGLAFGFAADTFTNIQSRLVLEVEHSTVQSVVLTRQNRFRLDLPRIIDNRPAALYALRSYLRLCMPFTIETQINTTVKLYERGGTPALNDAAARPMIDSRLVSTAVIRDVNRPMQRPREAPVIVDQVRVGPWEQKLVAGTIRNYQKAVCLTPDGKFTAQTRAAILKFLFDKKKKDQSQPDRITSKDGDTLMEIVDTGPKC